MKLPEIKKRLRASTDHLLGLPRDIAFYGVYTLEGINLTLKCPIRKTEKVAVINSIEKTIKNKLAEITDNAIDIDIQLEIV